MVCLAGRKNLTVQGSRVCCHLLVGGPGLEFNDNLAYYRLLPSEYYCKCKYRVQFTHGNI